MGCGNWLLWQLRKKWSQGEYRYVDVYLCVYWFSAVAYSSLWSTSCRNCDTIWVVATFLNQTICHCKTNSKILVFFLETTESIQKSADLSIQCEKPNVNILGTGCYLILHNRGRSTKWKKKSLLLPSESFPKLKAFRAVEDGKTEPLSEGAIVSLVTVRIWDQVESNLRSWKCWQIVCGTPVAVTHAGHLMSLLKENHFSIKLF